MLFKNKATQFDEANITALLRSILYMIDNKKLNMRTKDIISAEGHTKVISTILSKNLCHSRKT